MNKKFTNNKKPQVKRALNFDESAYAWKSDIDYRSHPEAYRIGRGEQGVLICEPYKSEIVAHWRFKTPKLAEISADSIYKMFLAYLEQDDFVGADMSRKFLQMGFTRARRYTNYKGGRKYNSENGDLLEKGTGDPLKAESAAIFFKVWKLAEAEPRYVQMKAEWLRK